MVPTKSKIFSSSIHLVLVHYTLTNNILSSPNGVVSISKRYQGGGIVQGVQNFQFMILLQFTPSCFLCCFFKYFPFTNWDLFHLSLRYHINSDSVVRIADNFPRKKCFSDCNHLHWFFGGSDINNI